MAAVIRIDGDEIRIRQATSQGWIGLPLAGGLADLSFPTSKLRRGRVQFDGQICPTLTCSGGELHIFERVDDDAK